MNRSCTDLLVCFVFCVFICGMVAVAGYGFLNGQPELLMTTFDADANACGLNTTVNDYPYLYFPMIDLEAAKKDNPGLDSMK